MPCPGGSVGWTIVLVQPEVAPDSPLGARHTTSHPSLCNSKPVFLGNQDQSLHLIPLPPFRLLVQWMNHPHWPENF